MLTYHKNKSYWNEVFKNYHGRAIKTKSIGHEDVDNALDWLCEDSVSILDFGCGNGVWLFKCLLRGTKKHFGIDLSHEGIRVANETYKRMGKGEFIFAAGGVEALESVSGDSIDGVILSNIIDNLIPADTVKVLSEIKRILKARGKVLIKLNPFLTDKQIKDWKIKAIEGNFLDDGLFLWNQTTEEWTELLEKYFRIVMKKDIYYPEHEQYNRLFLLCNDNK
ncbi:MAG: class I SAM-dependent methyltransferase [Caldicoprobacterales bacterium]|jgi:arsenite methyltransferase|nr:class I SAM-dependent methyltransferase [Clostridiales bacterium]